MGTGSSGSAMSALPSGGAPGRGRRTGQRGTGQGARGGVIVGATPARCQAVEQPATAVQRQTAMRLSPVGVASQRPCRRYVVVLLSLSSHRHRDESPAHPSRWQHAAKTSGVGTACRASLTPLAFALLPVCALGRNQPIADLAIAPLLSLRLQQRAGCWNSQTVSRPGLTQYPPQLARSTFRAFALGSAQRRTPMAETQCPTCRGRGVVPGEGKCDVCNGTGKARDPSGVATCGTCMGSGRARQAVTCPRCRGKGTI
jgi:hypothetical protein